jgi:hypothetical protein
VHGAHGLAAQLSELTDPEELLLIWLVPCLVQNLTLTYEFEFFWL